MLKIYTFLALITALCLSSCAGYKLGDVKPEKLKSVNSISVEQLNNFTLNPRVGVITTNSI